MTSTDQPGPAPDLFDRTVRLHVVTGKGGTGKTTIAIALATALARRGRSVLVAELEGRQGLARALGVAPLEYAEQHLYDVPTAGLTSPSTPGHAPAGSVWGAAIDPRSAVLEYLDRYYRVGPAGKALERLGAIEFVSSVAPGLRDVVLIGKAYDAARHPRPHGRQYDHVVLDAPPTGRIHQILGVNRDLSDLARFGPVAAQAASVAALVHSPATAVHLATLLEDLPVQETLEAVEQLRGSSLHVGAVFANRTRTAPEVTGSRQPMGDPGPDALAQAAARRGVPLTPGEATVLRLEFQRWRDRHTSEAAAWDRLGATGARRFALPELPHTVSTLDIATFADLLDPSAEGTPIQEVRR